MEQEVKQEYIGVDIWKGPPRGPIPEIPEINRNRKMTLVEYHRKVKNPRKLPQDVLEDETLRICVWKEIENQPRLWKTKSIRLRQSLYPRVAIQVYSRTGVVLLCSQVRKILRTLRSDLCNKLRRGIFYKKILNIDKLETYLWTWESYPFARFLRSETQKYEKVLRRRLLVDRNGNHLVFDISDDESNEKVSVKRNATNKNRVQVDAPNDPPTPENAGSTNVTDSSFQSCPNLPHQPVQKQQSINNLPPASFIEDSSQPEQDSPPRKKRRLDIPQNEAANESLMKMVQRELQKSQNDIMDDFLDDLDQIAHQAMRDLRDQPHRYQELRGALFDLVLNFGKYNNVEDLFSRLARKNGY